MESGQDRPSELDLSATAVEVEAETQASQAVEEPPVADVSEPAAPAPAASDENLAAVEEPAADEKPLPAAPVEPALAGGTPSANRPEEPLLADGTVVADRPEEPPLADGALIANRPEVPPLADGMVAANRPEDPPLADGTLVANRYRVIRLVETRTGGERVYQAEDLQICWSCGVPQLQAGLRFCEACGAVLLQWPLVALVETTAAEGSIAEDGRLFHVETLVEPPAASQPTHIHLTVGQQSNPGMQRSVNEDSLLVFHLTALCENRPAPQISLFAVADGIGGSDAGEVASRIAVRAMAEAFSRMVVQPVLAGEVLLVESLGEHLKEIVRHANQLILEKRKEKGLDMGATLTALLLYGEDGVIANVGDSRTYLFREGKLAQVTADHSVVASLVSSGLIKPEEVYYHEQRNVILRSIGDRPELEVDIFPVQARPGDRFVLCCDGLWEMVRGSMIEDVLLEQPDPQAACNRLVQYANQSGGEDNISVVVVDVHSL